jgi:diketogulonate reductase-like aldo/keto reductase
MWFGFHKSSKIERLKENLQAVNIKLSNEDIEKIKTFNQFMNTCPEGAYHKSLND